MTFHCRHVVLSSEIENAVVWSVDIRCTQLWFRTGVADKARFIPIH